MAADRGQRRPQLVRDRHEEVALQLLGLREPRRHLAGTDRRGGRSRRRPPRVPLRRSALAISSAACDSASTGPRSAARDTSASAAGDDEAERGTQSPGAATRVSQVSRSSVFGFATIRSPRTTAPPPSWIGCAAARKRRFSPGGVNSNVTMRSRRRSTPTSERVEPRQPAVLAREERSADVEEAVAGRELELGGSERRRGRPRRRARTAARHRAGPARRLAPQLVQRLSCACSPGRAGARSAS